MDRYIKSSITWERFFSMSGGECEGRGGEEEGERGGWVGLRRGEGGEWGAGVGGQG